MNAGSDQQATGGELNLERTAMIQRLSAESPLVLIDDERSSTFETEERNELPIKLPNELAKALQAFAAERDVDVETVLLAAYTLTLGRFAGMDRFVVGYSGEGLSKGAADVQQRTTALFIRIPGEQSFVRFIERIGSDLQSELDGSLSLEALVAGDPLSAAQLPTCYFVRSNLYAHRETASGARNDSQLAASKSALILHVAPKGDSFDCHLEHSPLLERLAGEFVESLLALIRQGVANSDERLASLKGSTDESFDSPGQVDVGKSIALSSAQRAMWVHLKTHPEKERYYNVGNYVELVGTVDAVLFARAVRHAVRTIAALRIRILESRAGTMQVIDAPSDFELPFVDCSGLPDPAAAAWDWMRSDEARQFGLDNARLFTMALLKVSEGRYFWYCHYSHMVIDGYGMQIVKERVSTAYSALCRGEDPPSASDVDAYRRYLADERDYRLSWEYTVDRQYWARFPMEGDAVTLSVRGGTAPIVADPIQSGVIELPSTLSSILKGQAKREGITLPKYMIALIALFLHKATGRSDLNIGLPVHGRFEAKSRGVSAPCVNVLPVRLSLHPQMDLPQLCAHVESQLKDALQHGRHRVEDIRRILGLRPGQFGLFNVVINVLPVPGTLDFGGIKGYTTTAGAITPGYVDDIIIWVFLNPESAQIVVKFEANPARYEPWEVKRLAALFAELLENVANDPPRVRQVSMLSRQSSDLLSSWSEGEKVPVGNLLSVLKEKSMSAPDALAAVMDGRVLTYREWEQRSNALANFLLAKVGRGAMVAVFMERSIETLVALIAIFKSENTYVPFDVADPIGRVETLLADANAAAILTESRLADRLPTSGAIVCVDLLSFATQTYDRVSDDAKLPQVAAVPAYCIFTSGSTGRPKGVCVGHDNLANHAFAMQAYFKLQSDDRVLQFASLAFDASLEEIFPTMLAGATLIVQPQRLLPTDRLLELISRESVSVLNLPLSYWERLTNDLLLQNVALPSCVRLVVVGGERLTTAAFRRWQSIPHRRSIEFLNTYGPTEGTVSAIAYRVEAATDSDSVPIGRPIGNVKAYVLDEELARVPPGLPGNLFLGGACVAQGYLRRDELTAERFIPDPFSNRPGDRIYRTGDRARFLPDGTLDFLGRFDGQIKLRGFRIELGEIEAVLLGNPEVSQCAVVLDAKEDRRRLVAFVVPTSERNAAGANSASLRAFLKNALPEYMIPSIFVSLSAMPLSRNGKVDRSALSAMDVQGERSTAFVAPRDEVEIAVARVWEEVLGVGSVGLHDNFFDLGGSSLLALETVARIEERLGVELPAGAFESLITLEQTAALVKEASESVPGLEHLGLPLSRQPSPN